MPTRHGTFHCINPNTGCPVFWAEQSLRKRLFESCNTETLTLDPKATPSCCHFYPCSLQTEKYLHASHPHLNYQFIIGVASRWAWKQKCQDVSLSLSLPLFMCHSLVVSWILAFCLLLYLLPSTCHSLCSPSSTLSWMFILNYLLLLDSSSFLSLATPPPSFSLSSVSWSLLACFLIPFCYNFTLPSPLL